MSQALVPIKSVSAAAFHRSGTCPICLESYATEAHECRGLGGAVVVTYIERDFGIALSRRSLCRRRRAKELN